MLAQAHTFTTDGILVERVTVEVDIRPGLPAFVIVGLADAAVREARERVRTAMRNCGFDFPSQRITANLAPADVPKAGPGLDLALACAVIGASGQARCERLAVCGLYGELALDGSVRPCRGALAAAQAARDAGLPALMVAQAQAHEAELVDELRVVAVESLRDAVQLLDGVAPARAAARRAAAVQDPDRQPLSRGGRGSAPARGERCGAAPRCAPGPDLADVHGQHQAVEAVVIAAAGGHNLLLCGAPGTGKTMLAQRIVSILPPLTRREAVEVASIHALANGGDPALGRARPFRAPHHSVTAAGLVGGAHSANVGEVVLAHRGVLFLDELSEFARPALEALRQPVEEGRLVIVRARRSAAYPARFILLAATNPCPCGFAGEGERCACSEGELLRHRRRLSGPLLDRMDMRVRMSRAGSGELKTPALTCSRSAQERVLLARERQATRLRTAGLSLNAEMDVRLLGMHARMDEAGEQMLQRACAQGLLSARGAHRALRVARTIADLGASVRVRAEHIGAALALRADTVLHGNRAA